jgi:hypothetical protein
MKHLIYRLIKETGAVTPTAPTTLGHSDDNIVSIDAFKNSEDTSERYFRITLYKDPTPEELIQLDKKVKMLSSYEMPEKSEEELCKLAEECQNKKSLEYYIMYYDQETYMGMEQLQKVKEKRAAECPKN